VNAASVKRPVFWVVDRLTTVASNAATTGLGYVLSTSDNEIVFRGMFQIWL